MQRLYCRLLDWHPLREEFGAEMLGVFAEAAAEQRRLGRWAYWQFCLRECAGLVCFSSTRETLMRHKYLVTGCAAAGFALALGATIQWAWTPYVSTAMLRLTPAMVPTRIAPAGDANLDQVLPRILNAVLSRSSLTNVINTADLYRGERSRMPMENVVDRLRNDLAITREPGDGVRIRFQYSDALTAQKIAQDFASRLIDEHVRHRSSQTLMTVEFLRHRQGAVGKSWEDSMVRLKNAAPGSAGSERARLESDIARKNYEEISTKLAEAETAKNLEERRQGPLLEMMDSASLPIGLRPPLWAALPLGLGGGLAGLVIGWLLARLWPSQSAPSVAKTMAS